MNRMQIWRRLTLLAALAVLALSLSGCGGVQATSWTGVSVANDTIYAADLQQVAALDPADGTVLWAFPENPAPSPAWAFLGDTEDGAKNHLFYATPAVGEGYVIVASWAPGSSFFGQPKNTVWGLHLETGKVWHFEDAKGQYIEGGTISDGIFVIGNSDGNVYALDVESGEPVWPQPFKTDHRVWATPLIVSGTVYIGAMDRHLYALNLADGQQLWQFPAKDAPAEGAFASAPALRDGVLYIGAFDNRLFAINAVDGSEKWHFEGEEWFWGSPVIDGDAVYAVDVKGSVYALNRDTGQQIWRKRLDGAQPVPVRAGATLSEDGSTLFISSQKNGLYALNTADGTVQWSSEGEGQGLSAPVLQGTSVYESKIQGSYRLRALDARTGNNFWVHPPPEPEED